MNTDLDILFEDNRFVFLNKPAGMASHGVVRGRLGAIEALRQQRPDAPYLELAHRLDKATSGCLVIAKRKSALRAFQREQSGRGVDKHYLALLKGEWKGGHRKVDAPLLKSVNDDGSWSVRVDKAGKRAVSYFAPIKVYAGMTLADIKIITGRTHQIRVHAAHIGFPVAGDEVYGDKRFNRDFERLCLHAASICFCIPHAGEYDIQAPWSDMPV